MKKLLSILLLLPILVNAQTYQPTDTIVGGTGEYAGGLINLANMYMYGLSNNMGLVGSNNIGTPGIPAHAVTSPTTQQFLSVWGALHGYGGIDVSGYFWAVGEGADGQYGNGVSGNNAVANKITVDSAGTAFTNLVAAAAFFTGNAHNGWAAIKSDGTLWVWGNLTDSMRGNGTGGQTLVKPVKITIPGGRLAIQVLAGQKGMALCSDGTVWEWGGITSSIIHQVTGLSGITQIAGGILWNFAYNSSTKRLYRWGPWGNYMGKPGGGTTGGGTSIPIPEEATELETALNMPTLSIRQIVTNSDATMAIMSDGTLHGWGDNVQGCVGIGSEINWATYTVGGTPYPYANNLGTGGQVVILQPVQIGYKTDWKAIYGASVFTYYWYAIDLTNLLYSWGRDKTMTLGRGIGIASSNLSAQYPNSNDITWPTHVSPFALTKTFYITSPWCLSNPTATYCSEFSHGPYSAIVVNAGGNQTVNINSAILVGSSTDTTLSFVWSIPSAPGSPHFVTNTDGTTNLVNLSPGATTARLTAINNGFVSYTNDAIITYSTASTHCTFKIRPICH